MNPRIGSFDIKTFNELRPGLILWALIDISCMCEQYVRFGQVTESMVLVLIFHTWYAFDAIYYETVTFSQMDITTDGFGFMLSIGDLAWVPFIYSLQAKYLAIHPVRIGVAGVAGVLLIQLLGFYIFRDANTEKNEFRNGRNPRSTLPQSPSLTRRPADDEHGLGPQASYFRLVGPLPAPELSRRLDHGLGMVPAVRLLVADPLLLRCLLRHTPRPPPAA